ncbi:hypothetical protein D3C78_1614570 [compost metagenome]
MAQRRQPCFSEGLADRIALVAPRVIKKLIVQRLVRDSAGLGLVLLAIGRVGEGVVALHLLRGTHLLAVAQTPQAGTGLVATATGVVQHLVGAEIIFIQPKRFIIYGL